MNFFRIATELISNMMPTRPYVYWSAEHRRCRYGIFLSVDGFYKLNNICYKNKKDLKKALLRLGIRDDIFLEALPEPKDFIIDSAKKMLGVNIHQGNSIKLGNKIEEIIVSYIESIGGEILNKFTKNRKGKKQVDLYFRINGITYYYEIKLNLHLDSEKSVSTANKIEYIISNDIRVDHYGILCPTSLNGTSKYKGKMVLSLNAFLNSLGIESIAEEDFLINWRKIGIDLFEKQQENEDIYNKKLLEQRQIICQKSL